MYSPRLRRVVVSAGAAVAVAAFGLSGMPAARADTAPAPGSPATVSADPLPTVQIDGVVWAQATVGNTVYVVGSFQHARPAGTPVNDPSRVARANLLAYDITTGQLITAFNHALNAQAKAVAVSPDGTRLYVGGDFTAVDGHPHQHIAEFDLTTGALLGGFYPGPSGTVRALAATNTGIYAGGSFTSLNDGTPMSNLVAYHADGTRMTSWAATANRAVYAMVLAPDGSKVIVGGGFSQLDRQTFYATGALTLTTGAALPWATSHTSYPIRDQVKPGAPSSAVSYVTSLSTDGNQIYLGSMAFVSGYGDGTFEGRAAISPTDGSIIWVNDCHGDTYSAVPIGQVLYSVGHAHDCQPVGGYAETTPRSWQRTLAESTYATGVDGPATHGYPSFQGYPDATLLDWFPTLAPGTYTGTGQAAWSVTGNSNYISLGGEFPTVNKVAQQGLVRFAISAIAPNKVGPVGYPRSAVVTTSDVRADGTAVVSWPTTWDMDNAVLTYRLYRDGALSSPVSTTTYDSRFWSLPSLSFTDSGLIPGTPHTYRLQVSDPFGNTITSYTLLNDTAGTIGYYGGWNYVSSTTQKDLDNDLHATTDPSASATLSFFGTGVDYIAPKGPNSGTAQILVDGVVKATVSANSSSYQAQQILYSVRGLTRSTHTLTIQNLSGPGLIIDGFNCVN